MPIDYPDPHNEFVNKVMRMLWSKLPVCEKGGSENKAHKVSFAIKQAKEYIK